MRRLRINNNPVKAIEKINTLYSGSQLFTLLLLFPVYAVKDVSHFTKSSLSQLLSCGKDVFYEFLNCPFFNWQKLSIHITKQLICRVEKHSCKSEKLPFRCLIADDTDLPKSGRCFELLRRIYSHVTHSFNYGFKGLFLGYHDGKSFFGLDFSLHGEKGKDKEKPFGLTKKQAKKRYTGKRPGKSFGQQRINDYFKTKTDMLIEMISLMISAGIKFDCLLTDSRFKNYELIRFIATRKTGCFFLGMVKNGNTIYHYKGKELTFSGILKVLKHSRKAGYSKMLNCKFYEAEVELKGFQIKLYFCKTTKKSKLLTTNTKLTFEEAFEIYATRWTIEVFFGNANNFYGLENVNPENLRLKSPLQQSV